MTFQLSRLQRGGMKCVAADPANGAFGSRQASNKPGTMRCDTPKSKFPFDPVTDDISGFDVPDSDIEKIRKRHEKRPASRPQLDIRDYEDEPREEERRPSVTEPEHGVCIMSM